MCKSLRELLRYNMSFGNKKEIKFIIINEIVIPDAKRKRLTFTNILIIHDKCSYI